MITNGILNIFGGTGNKIFVSTSRKFNLNCTLKMSKDREAKMMIKLLANRSSKKRRYYFEDIAPSASLNIGKSIKQNKENSRRIAVLNTLFMKHISDLMMTENINANIIGKGLEISRVSMTPDFKLVNVFWATSKENEVTSLEKVLPQVGFTLRHELTQLRVMGVVPRIAFVRDKHYYSALRVEELLAIADFGEDYVPSHSSGFVEKVEGTSAKVESSSTKVTKGQETSKNDEQTEDVETPVLDEEPLPTMRQDIFGLDRELIMNKILKSMQKARALHRFEPNLAVYSEGVSEVTNNSQVVDSMTPEERKAAIKKFLIDRKVMMKEKNKDKYNSMSNLTINEEEGNREDDNDYDDFKTEDYIDEQFFEEDREYKI